MKYKYQTIPPECQVCGVMPYPDLDVQNYPEFEHDPKWPTWLCDRCWIEATS